MTGETPLVDVQSVTQQRVIAKEIVDAIPAGRSHLDLAVLIPGLQETKPTIAGVLMDVGGTDNLRNTTMSLHGGRTGDSQVMIDGVSIRNLSGSGQ